MLFWAAPQQSHQFPREAMHSLLGDGMDRGGESLGNVKIVMDDLKGGGAEDKQLVKQEACPSILSELSQAS